MRRPNEEEEEEAEGKSDSVPLLLPALPLLPVEGGGLSGARARRLPLSSTSLAIDSNVPNPLRRTSLSPASSRYTFMQVSRGEKEEGGREGGEGWEGGRASCLE